MQHATPIRRLFSLLLVLSLLAALLVPASAAENGREAAFETEPALSEGLGMEEHAANELVRVSIELDTPSVFDAGYSMDAVAANADAVAYRDGLKAAQARVRGQIEEAIGAPLNVKHSMTLLLNVLSAEVRYGDLQRIKAVPGVKSVEPETRYDAPEPVNTEEAEPNTANTSSYMVGAAEAWAEGYTGAGSRIAIIDTGLDTTHQSFNVDAFNYAIQQTGKTVSLFTQSDLNAIKSQLNGSGAEYVSAKIPFGYNYVDEDTTINHMSDTQGEHGSHVAGIAAANRFIKDGSAYNDAASTVRAVGMAPDAQLFVMKVFGSGGGAYDSDYMVAIEDAIVLGCDAANLSLGSASPGFTHSGTSSYQTIMNKLANANSNTKLVVSISAGNNGPLTQHLTTDLYIQDVAMHTGGNPGSFINSLCTASADNTGVTGTPMTFNGSQLVFYNETSNSGGTLASVPGSYSYVYIDATGSADDYSAVNASLSLSGKVVIVNRGDNTFVEKGNNLKSYNPKALIVANNADGSISMALDDYTGSFPMVSITRDDANTIKANSTVQTVGSYTCYTGSVTVSATLLSEQITDNAEMSSFSSWGVPGSLLMKPEITTPGGNIYSVFGTNQESSGTAGGSDQYELMSGTSMAAPHVAGLTGTLGQYMRENNVNLSGKTTRQLVQSLLMSTAEPMHIGSAEGPYYPILQQGAGLANVRQAIHASSFIFMNSDATISYADGKVKAELGDKPSRSGTYSYSFKIYNTASVAQSYALSTDLFTQDRYVGEDGYAHMSSSTVALPWEVSYSTGSTVTVPAGGNQSVTVTISIPADMSAFDELYPKGAYLEGYTFVESQTTTRDGAELDVRHSIPILGFYGSWTDPSMFDNMSYVDQTIYGETRVPYTGVSNTNYMTYTRGGTTKYVTGNPYFTETPFPEDRLALRSTDTISQIKYSLVRSAGTTGVAASKIDDAGSVTSVLSASVSSTRVVGLYYSSSSAAWMNTAAGTASVGKTVSSYGVSDGERIRVGFYAIPEYYAMKVNSDVNSYSAGYLNASSFQTVLRGNTLGKGAMVGYDFYVDDSAPGFLSAIRSANAVTVTVQDNAYIAKLALMNGSTTLEELIPAQSARGEAVTYSFDISGVADPSNLRVFAGDYASNETTVVPEELLYEISASSNNDAWGTVSVAGNTVLAQPAEGYYVESVQVVAGTANPVVSGNTVTVNPGSDCEILVIFAPKPLYAVSFRANGADEGSVTAYVNDEISLPQTIANTDIAEGYSFIGWYVENLPETTDKPVYYEPGASYTVTADATLLALFKRVEGNDGEIYRLLTEMPAELSGNYVISSGTTASDYLMLNTTGVYYRNSDACTTFANGGITIEDGVLYDVLPSQAFVVTPNSTGDSWRIMMLSIDGTYVADSNTGLTSTTNAENDLNCWTAAFSDGRFKLASKNYSNYVIGLNTSYNAFDTIRNGTGAYLWKGEPGGTAYYTTNPLTESHDHILEHFDAAAPSCLDAGNIEYWRCSLCGKYFSDAAGETQITLADTVIAALGHDYVDVVIPPTETQQGYTTHTCSRCGDSYVDSWTAPLGSDYPVHFSVPAGVTKPADMISNTNTGITLPEVEAPEGYTFLGWVTEDYDNVDVRPAQILTGNYIAPQEITLKALFTYVEGGSGETVFELVTADPGDWTGTYAVSYFKNNSMYLLTGINAGSYESSTAGGSTSYASAGVSLSGTTLSNVGSLYRFDVEAKGSSWSIRNQSKGTFLQNQNGTMRSAASYDASTCDWTLTPGSNTSVAIRNTNATSYPHVSFNTSNNYFWAMTSANTNIHMWRETPIGTFYYTTIIGEEHVHTPAEPVIENNVDPTCTAAGSYDSVVYCTACGEELSRETISVPALGHDYVAVVTEPTCTEAGYTTYTCSCCSDTYVGDETAALGHLPGEPVQENYVEPAVGVEGGYDTVVYCQRCGEELSREHTVLPALPNPEPIETSDLRIYSSISVGTDMVVTWTARKTDVASYEKFWIEVVKHAADGDETYLYGAEQAEALNEGSTSWSCDFKHIFAKEMGVEIEARVYAEDANGQIYRSPAKSTSIRDYLGGRLTATNNSVSQRVLAADMLNYGAAAQLYMGYDTEHLVNEELTADQLAKLDEYETKELPVVEKTNSNYRPEGQSNILFNSVSLDNEVILSLTVRAAEGADVKVLMKDHESGTVLETLDAAWNGSNYVVNYSGIGADKMRVAYDFVAQIDGAETGNVRTWSVEGYVGELRNGSNQAQINVANALLAYGDAAASYFAAQ